MNLLFHRAASTSAAATGDVEAEVTYEVGTVDILTLQMILAASRRELRRKFGTLCSV